MFDYYTNVSSTSCVRKLRRTIQLYVSPAPEKRHSEGTLVGRALRYFLASFERIE